MRELGFALSFAFQSGHWLVKENNQGIVWKSDGSSETLNMVESESFIEENTLQSQAVPTPTAEYYHARVKI